MFPLGCVPASSFRAGVSLARARVRCPAPLPHCLLPRGLPRVRAHARGSVKQAAASCEGLGPSFPTESYLSSSFCSDLILCCAVTPAALPGGRTSRSLSREPSAPSRAALSSTHTACEEWARWESEFSPALPVTWPVRDTECCILSGLHSLAVTREDPLRRASAASSSLLPGQVGSSRVGRAVSQ